MPKVSVIIPFLNPGSLIGPCARSLFDQTLDDIEYIFVDDCSDDGSCSILESVMAEYPARIQQVKVIHNQANLGCAQSRKVGCDMALGDYLITCDADDCVDPTMYAKMYAVAVRDGADMVICDFMRVYPDGTRRHSGPQRPSEDLLEDLLLNRIDNYLWNKMLRRSLLDHDVTFPVANVWEDVALSPQLAYYCEKVSWVDEALYHYNVNPGSLVHSEIDEGRLADMKANIAMVEDFLRSKGIFDKYSSALVRPKENVKANYFSRPRKEYMSVYPEIAFRLFFSPAVPFSKRLGHLSKMLGIHGGSRVFRGKR